MPPSSAALETGGSSASPSQTSNHPPTVPSYAAVTAKPIFVSSRLTAVPLAHRPPTYVDNIPAVLLTSIEEEQLRKQRENTILMKFYMSFVAT